MKENTSGLLWMTSTVKMKAPAMILYFSMTKNLDSIPLILSVLPGSLLSEWIATLRSASGEGEACLASGEKMSKSVCV